MATTGRAGDADLRVVSPRSTGRIHSPPGGPVKHTIPIGPLISVSASTGIPGTNRTCIRSGCGDSEGPAGGDAAAATAGATIGWITITSSILTAPSTADTNNSNGCCSTKRESVSPNPGQNENIIVIHILRSALRP